MGLGKMFQQVEASVRLANLKVMQGTRRVKYSEPSPSQKQGLGYFIIFTTKNSITNSPIGQPASSGGAWKVRILRREHAKLVRPTRGESSISSRPLDAKRMRYRTKSLWTNVKLDSLGADSCLIVFRYCVIRVLHCWFEVERRLVR